MRPLAGIVGVVVSAFAVAGPAGAGTQSLDTCKVTGSGSTYTVRISVEAGSEQYGFAFGAGGASVANAVIPGNNGSFSTQNLATNTTGAWISDTALTGNVVATLTVSGTPSAPFTVVPAGAAQAMYFDPVTCSSGTVASPAAALTVASHAVYRSSAGTWRLAVTLPGAGRVTALQLEPTVGTATAKSHTAKPLVKSNTVAAHSRGKYTLTLRATSDGLAALKAHGTMKVELHVVFDAQSGKSGVKTLSLTLRR
jgi:hypothetical protein